MRRVLIGGIILAILLLLLVWQHWGDDLIRSWLLFQRNVNGYISSEMRAVKEGHSLLPLAGGLGLAFLYGAVHALGPGHGKFVVASYLATRNSKPWHGVLMAARIGTMHVLSAVIVVAFADILLRRTFGGIPAEVPAIRIAAYSILTVTGIWMLVHALRRLRERGVRLSARPGTALVQAHLGRRPAVPPPLATSKESAFLALGVGLVPCTGSILILSFAIANGVLWAGYLLVAAIALGMTLTMSLLGLGAVHLNRMIARRARADSIVPRILDLTGAAAAIGVGMLLLSGALIP